MVPRTSHGTNMFPCSQDKEPKKSLIHEIWNPTASVLMIRSFTFVATWNLRAK